MNYNYGTTADSIDNFFRAKKTWSLVKDKIVNDYITCYLKTVHKLKRPILIVDGFSGPGRFGDDTKGSPLLICEAIHQQYKNLNQAGCLFSDTRLSHREALIENLKGFISAGICEKPFENCSEVIKHALSLGGSSTIFFYLDPYGIKDLEFDLLKQIYNRNQSHSTEVLINFNFRTFMRMSGNWKYGDSSNEISKKVKSSKLETVNKVMGGDYWLNIITDPNLTKIEREEKVVESYLNCIKQYFKFAYSVPVKERNDDEHNIPEDELARYHLIFGTRSPRAVRYMNDVAIKALAPYFSQFKDGLLFDFTPERYQSINRQAAKDAIVNAVTNSPKTRPEIYEEIIPGFFMHYQSKDYRAMVDELTFEENRLYPDKSKMKRKNMLNDETALSAMPWPGAN